MTAPSRTTVVAAAFVKAAVSTTVVATAAVTATATFTTIFVDATAEAGFFRNKLPCELVVSVRLDL